MLRGRLRSRVFLIGLSIGLLSQAIACTATLPLADPRHRHSDCVENALSREPTMMSLAHDLDKVEKHIEWFGTVVPKVPDVWGQARLTKHREEFEEVMSADLYGFEVKLNGALTRADSAFFAQALALSAAIQPPPRRLLSGQRTLPNGLTETTTQTTLIPPPAVVTATSSTPAPSGAAPAVSVTNTNPPTTVTSTATVTAPIPMDIAFHNGVPVRLIDRDKDLRVRLPQATIGLEPTLVLEQKARYLNLLNQIRRTNEGDDTADSPGYSLNLMRIPVSILPGKKTLSGYGAEITFTLTPVLSDELLPMTFRSLVLNDLVDQLSFPLARFLEDEDQRQNLRDTVRKNVREAAEKPQNIKVIPPKGKGSRRMMVDKAEKEVPYEDFQRNFKEKLTIPTLPPAKGLQARAPFPNSQIIDVYGVTFSFEVAYQANKAFEDPISLNGYAHLPDIQSFLQSELNAAYRFLAEPGNQVLWGQFCTQELVTAIRNRNVVALKELRKGFRTYFKGVSSPPGKDEQMEFSVTAALAWCILVDSALLTDRLIQDMKETATAKGCAPFCEGWLDFYTPCPSPEARQAFLAYVQCRWPIHVFALDPANQEQNLADALETRRETQLALSLAFVSGQINANSMTRYARRLEAQYETIALNRTQVGFSHGEHTFGWRFTPRFQTPDTEPNLTVLFRDQLIGGPSRDALLRQRRLEPGPRECVAIVLMPSFVPCVTCDSVANWFALANPKHKAFDHTQAMKVSRAIKALQVHGPGVSDAECYRDGDFARLLRRIEQLDARLPTQTMTVPVPVVNTLGGFEMFNNGTTDLAPELYGFYGAPGVRTDDFTTLFLVGDHLSPLRTKVIVGNKECRTEMLSRQVVKVVTPPFVLSTNDNYVHSHVATPYGVSREIQIPLARPLGTPAEEFALAATNWTVNYRPESETDAQGKPVLVNNKQVFRYRFLNATPRTTDLFWLGVPAARPDAIDVDFEFAITKQKISVRIQPDAGGVFPLPVEDVAEKLLEQINGLPQALRVSHEPWSGGLQPKITIKTVPATGSGVEKPLRKPHDVVDVRAVPSTP